MEILKYRTSPDSEWKSLEALTGEGVPAGGKAGQVLTKKSDTDYDTEWTEPTGGSGASTAVDVSFDDSTTNIGVSDVQAAIEYLIRNGGGGGGAIWEYPTQVNNDLRLFQGLTILQINNGLEVY